MKINVMPVAPRPERIVADSDAEYVSLLNATARIPADTNREYMMRFSTCYESISGIRVRFTSPEEFVTDLKDAGRVIQKGSTYTLLPPLLSASHVSGGER